MTNKQCDFLVIVAVFTAALCVLDLCLLILGWPNYALYEQPLNVVRAQLIHPSDVGRTRWWGKDATMHKCKKTEEESLKEGFQRWYRLYDYKDYDCVYGHSVFYQPFIHQREGFGRTVVAMHTLLPSNVYKHKKNFSLVWLWLGSASWRFSA